MILLRLSPLIPYNALDYISGVTSIPLRDYSLALVGILPGTILFCFVGATASSLADGSLDASGHRGLRLFALTFGLLSAFAGVYTASYYSKQELDKVCFVRIRSIYNVLRCGQQEYHAHCRHPFSLACFLLLKDLIGGSDTKLLGIPDTNRGRWFVCRWRGSDSRK
jgi:hypothetical protein